MAAANNPGVWFEVPARDLEGAKSFYEQVLQVELDRQESDGIRMAWFPMSDDVYGAAGALATGDACQPSAAGTVVYLSTPDLDAALERARDHGGTVLLERTSIGEHGFIGMMLDCEGNRVGLHSMT
jgi:hypothetical protein